MFAWKLLFHFPIEFSIKARLRYALSNAEAHCNNWALNGRQFLAFHILSPAWSSEWAIRIGPGVNPDSSINLSADCGQNRVLHSATASSNFSLWLQTPGNMSCILLYIRVQTHRTAWVRRDHWTTLSNPPALIWVQLEQVVQGYVWSGSECLRGWRLHNLSGQPVSIWRPIFKWHLLYVSVCLLPLVL